MYKRQGIGGAIGAILRYGISCLPIKNDFPILTLITNMLGALLIGIVVGLAERENISSSMTLFLKTGVCGGFTTFSTFSLEAMNLMDMGKYGVSLLYIGLSVMAVSYTHLRRLAPDNRFYDFTHDIYMDTVVQDGLDPRDFDQIFKVYVACFAPEEEKLETLNDLPWCRFHKEYLFVEPGDKSVGIKAIVDHFGGDYKDVVVFGDEKNDLSMFIDEWTSIAVSYTHLI